MARIIYKNGVFKKYKYSFLENTVEFLKKGGLIRYKSPKIEIESLEEEWEKITIRILKQRTYFFYKQNSLSQMKIESMWLESFLPPIIQGHSYIRKEIKIKPGDIVIDAGGCEGFFTRYALLKGAALVVCLEPCSVLADGLERSFEKEISEGKVIIARYALSDSKKSENLCVNTEMICSSTTLEELSSGEDKYFEEISTLTLDEVVDKYKLDRVNLVKMDIEGAELAALKGCEKVIKRWKPRMVIAIYHQYDNGHIVAEIGKRFNPAYRVKACGKYMFEETKRPYLTLLY